MRRAARVDANQSEIVSALRQAGCSVQCLHTIGKGCPDLLVGHWGINVLLKVKSGWRISGGLRSAYKRLTPDEKQWHESWQGQVIVVGFAREAVTVIERLTGGSCAEKV